MFTANERNGIFTTAVKDPFTGTPFPNNTIPQNRLDPISQNILKLIPQPNNPGDPARDSFTRRAFRPHAAERDRRPGRLHGGLQRHDIRPLPVRSGSIRHSSTTASTRQFQWKKFQPSCPDASAHWNRVLSPNTVNSFTLGFTRYRNQNSTLNAFKQDFVATSVSRIR